jgi:hypothetical protein
MIRARPRTYQGVIMSVVAAAALTLIPQAAASASAPVHNTDSFSEQWTFVSRPLNYCIDFSLKGTITYNAAALPTQRGPEFSLTSIHLNDPVLKAVVHRFFTDDGCLTGKGSVSKISMGQHWSGYSCSFTPSVGVSIPWGVSAGGWPDCGNRKQASYSTTYNSGKKFTQNNSQSQASFENEGSPSSLGKPKICYGVYVSAVAWRGNTSDSYAAGDGSASKKFCLTPQYS